MGLSCVSVSGLPLDCRPGVGRAGFCPEGSTRKDMSKLAYVYVAVDRIQFLWGSEFLSDCWLEANLSSFPPGPPDLV